MARTPKITKNTSRMNLPLPMTDLSLPDSDNRGSRSAAARSKPKPAPAKADATGKANAQAFLPGLSRRGRPRLKNAPSAAARAASSRRRRTAAGAKRVELMLDADILAQLDALAAHLDENRAGVVGWLVARAAARLLK
jgi:hypothetical protein